MADLDWETFDQFVYDPYAQSIYEAPEIDLGFDQAGVRLWALAQTILGVGEILPANVRVEVDYRAASEAYGGWRSWSVGTVTVRFIKARLVLVNTGAGVAGIKIFTPTVDVAARKEQRLVSIPAGGMSIPFETQFNRPPVPTIIALGSTSLVAVPGMPTTTECSCRVFDTTTGADAASTVTVSATFEGA